MEVGVEDEGKQPAKEKMLKIKDKKEITHGKSLGISDRE